MIPDKPKNSSQASRVNLVATLCRQDGVPEKHRWICRRGWISWASLLYYMSTVCLTDNLRVFLFSLLSPDERSGYFRTCPRYLMNLVGDQYPSHIFQPIINVHTLHYLSCLVFHASVHANLLWRGIFSPSLRLSNKWSFNWFMLKFRFAFLLLRSMTKLCYKNLFSEVCNYNTFIKISYVLISLQ